MSRFERELSVVPGAARWGAALLGIAIFALFSGAFLSPALAGQRLASVEALLLGSLALVGSVSAAVYVMLIGYVWGDAKRRGMRYGVWTLLVVCIPNAVGIIIYFILRDPLAAVCQSCGAVASKGHAFCAACGAALQATCPQCHRLVDGGWRYCIQCGATLGDIPVRGEQPA